MINLLPPKDRLAIDLAKKNTILRRYIELGLIAVVLVAVLIVGSFYYLTIQKNNTQKTLDINNAKLSELDDVQQNATQLSATINTISALLARDVNFSKMLVQIGQLMPAKSVLAGLQLSSVDSEAPLSITAQVDSEDKAAVLRNNLVASSLFKSANIKTITKIGDDATSNGSPAPAVGGSTGTQPTSTEVNKDSPYKYIVVIDAYFKTVEKAK